MAFHVGQKVVHVGFPSEGWFKDIRHRIDRFFHPYINPTVGEVYTVAAVRTANDGDLMLVLVEHEGCDLEYWEPGFKAVGFRPVVERKTDIGFAHEILRKVTKRTTEPSIIELTFED